MNGEPLEKKMTAVHMWRFPFSASCTLRCGKAVSLWHRMSVRSSSRVMQQDGNCFCWFPFITLITPGGFSYYFPPPPTSAPCLSHSHQLHHSPLRSHNQIKGSRVERRVHFGSVVHLCMKIKPSPFLSYLMVQNLDD